ncbi:MAG: hypothetical protein MI784_07475 [Cytophagales bacterium]|nr:hypothetical protein [Cytophagales bacterium]
MKQAIRSIGWILFFLVLSKPVFSQNSYLTLSADSLPYRLQEKIRVQDSLSRKAIDELAGSWGSYSTAHRELVRQTLDVLLRVSGNRKHVADWTEILVAVKQKDNDQNLSSFLSGIRQLVKTKRKKELVRVLTDMRNFYRHDAVHYEPAFQVRFANARYSTEWFIEPESGDSGTNGGTVDDEVIVDDGDDDGLWEQDTAEDGFQDGQAEQEESPFLYYSKALETPEFSGVRKVVFETLDLVISNKSDTFLIKGTAGEYWPEQELFIGKGGKVDWTVAGLPEEKASAALGEYILNLQTSDLKAVRTLLNFPEKLNRPVEGEYKFRLVDFDKKQTAFPSFVAYKSDYELKHVSPELLQLRGGFALEGKKLSSKALDEGFSLAVMSKNGKEKLRLASRSFNLSDSSFSANRASLFIMHGRDSITHPSVNVEYNLKDSLTLLTIRRRKKSNYAMTGFRSSFFKMDIKADYLQLYWDKDSLDIKNVKAREFTPIFFESEDYYNEDNYKELSQSFSFNPVGVLVSHRKKHGENEFSLSSLQEMYPKINSERLRIAMEKLREHRFIDYNSETGWIKILKKTDYYRKARRGKVDYDQVAIPSRISGLPNASLNLNDTSMEVRGIAKLYLSRKKDVYAEPVNKRIQLLRNRNIHFDGQINAGTFEFLGKGFDFDYDKFTVALNKIDSIQFFVKDPETGERIKVKNNLMASANADSTETNFEHEVFGTLYIDHPRNKSGKKGLEEYPYFNSKKGATVYFDSPTILDGAYDRSVYFEIPPFEVDSLNQQDYIGFTGTFYSGGIFPPFKQQLMIMQDKSLGFMHKMPPEGMPLYDGKGKYYNEVKLDGDGLRGDGNIQYISASVESPNFVFYIDSVKAKGPKAEVKAGIFEGASFPDMQLANFRMNWDAKNDSLRLFSTDSVNLMAMYQSSAVLDGNVVVSKEGLFGSGKLTTRFSETLSFDYQFREKEFEARHAKFKIESLNPDKPAVYGDDVALYFSIEEDYADISPENVGVASISFPYSQMKTSINNARWHLSEDVVRMSKPEDVPIASSYFYATKKELDSLVFNATEAEYKMESQEMHISGIPFIRVADAKIIPHQNQVTIFENATINTLKKASLVMDTTHEHHNLYNGNISIFSRNTFMGNATYRFVNAVQDTFSIQFGDFESKSVHTEKKFMDFIKSKKERYRRHTVAGGEVTEQEEMIISPGMFFKGKITMYASRKALKLKGHVKLDLKNIPDYNTWIAYENSNEEQQEVRVDFDESLTEDGEKLQAGIFFEDGTNDIYTTFVANKRNEADYPFFTPSGELSYNPEKGAYIIVDTAKANGNSYQGKLFEYNEESSDVEFEGVISILTELEHDKRKRLKIDATAVKGKGNINNSEISLNSLMVLEWPMLSHAFEAAGEEWEQYLNDNGRNEAEPNTVRYVIKLSEYMGHKGAKAFEQRRVSEEVKPMDIERIFTKNMSLSNVNLQWSEENKAWFNPDGKIGMMNLLDNNIDHRTEGYFEIVKGLEGDRVTLFYKINSGLWMYLAYDGAENHLTAFSSSDGFNAEISKRTNVSKAKIGELILDSSSQDEVLQFIKKFRYVYMNKEEDYELHMPQKALPAVEQEDDDYVDPLFSEEDVSEEEKKKYADENLYQEEEDTEDSELLPDESQEDVKMKDKDKVEEDSEEENQEEDIMAPVDEKARKKAKKAEEKARKKAEREAEKARKRKEREERKKKAKSEKKEAVKEEEPKPVQKPEESEKEENEPDSEEEELEEDGF